MTTWSDKENYKMSWIHKFIAKKRRGTSVAHAAFRETALADNGLSATKSSGFSREI